MQTANRAAQQSTTRECFAAKKRFSGKLDYFPFDSFSLSFVCLLRDFLLFSLLLLMFAGNGAGNVELVSE